MIKKKFDNLKAGSKRIFVGLMTLSLICTASGIGTIFTYATEDLDTVCDHSGGNYSFESIGEEGHRVICGDCGEEVSVAAHDFSDGVCTYCGFEITEEENTDPENPEGDGDTDPENPEGEPSDDTDDAASGDSDENHEHDYQYSYAPNDDGTHTVTITCACGDSSSETEECIYGDDGKCQYCGQEKKEDESSASTSISADHEHKLTECWYPCDEPGKHYKVCTVAGCDYEEIEDCSYEWVSDKDGHKYVCSKCGYEDETKAGKHDFTDENGDECDTCAICGYVRESTEKKALLKSSNMLRGITQTVSGGANYEVESNSGSIRYEDIMDSMPVVISEQKYNGNGWKLDDFVKEEGTTKAPADVYCKYVTMSWAPVFYDSNGNIHYFESEDIIDVGVYKLRLRIEYGELTSDGYDGRVLIVYYYVSIVPAEFSDLYEVTGETNFIDSAGNYIGENNLGNDVVPYFILRKKDGTVASSDEYTRSVEYTLEQCNTFYSYATPGQSITYTFAPKSGDTNFISGSTISKTCTVYDPILTYKGIKLDIADESETECYYGKVTLVAPDGYEMICTNNTNDLIDGYGTFSQSLEFSSSGTYEPNIYVRNISRTLVRHYVKLTPKFKITFDKSIDNFWEAPPEFNDEDLIYNGSPQPLVIKEPVFKPEFLEYENEFHLFYSWWYKYYNRDHSYITDKKTERGKDPIDAPYETMPGEYKLVNIWATDFKNFFTSPKRYYCEQWFYIRVDINSKFVTYTPNTEVPPDYQSALADYDFSNMYSLSLAGDLTGDLNKDVDYTVTVPEIGIPETGTVINIVFTGVKDQYYTGTAEKTIPVSVIDVKFNGAAQKTKYNDEVTVTADGYTISESADGIYESEIKYTTPRTSDLTLYFKHNTTGRVVKQTIKDFNIENVGITPLYNDETEPERFYYGSVDISAEGYYVSNEKKGTYGESYKLEYDASKNMQPVDDFLLYFKDAEGKIHIKTISGIVLYAALPKELNLAYNGSSNKKDWYNDLVKVTVSDSKYTMSLENKGSFKDSIDLDGTDIVAKEIFFKEVATGKVFPTTVAVSIDKLSPIGTITAGSASASSFNTVDGVAAYINSAESVSIAASDDLSGLESIKYIECNEFYDSEEALTAGITSKKLTWKNYSSTKPKLTESGDTYLYVMLTDKAENTAVISMGSIKLDSNAPELTQNKVNEGNDGTCDITLEGTDDYSGIREFRLIVKELTSKDTVAPSKSEMLSTGTIIAVSEEEKLKASGTYKVTGLDSSKDYAFYLAAVDRAGNVSKVISQYGAIGGELATIQVGSYKSGDFVNKEEVALYTKTAEKITVTLSDTAYGIDKTEYYITDKYYETPGDVEAAVSDKSWKEYFDSYPPSTSKEGICYVYVRLTDVNGSKHYLSTGSIVCDAIAPVMEIASSKEESDGSYVLSLEGTDELSGMSSFTVLSMKDNDGSAEVPDAETMQKDGILIEALGDANKKVKTDTKIKNIKKNQDYAVFIMASDKAGNNCEIITYYIYGENSGSPGKITVDKYASTIFQTKDAVALYTKTEKKAAITVNKTATTYSTIEYYVGDTYFGNPTELEASITENKKSWIVYEDQYKITLNKDSKNYIYARFTSKNGKNSYLSTGCIYYDTVAPKVLVNKVEDTGSGTSFKLTLGGEDDLSGISSFKMLYTSKASSGDSSAKTSSESAATPTEESINSKGTVIKVQKEEKLIAGAAYTASGLQAGMEYTFYFIAVDNAGNISPATTETPKVEKKTEKKDSGLTPAPSGIAGQPVQEKKKAQEKAPEAEKPEEKKETITRSPYISDATGSVQIGMATTSGWPNISREVKGAERGTSIDVEMSGTKDVSGEFFEALTGRDVTVKLKMSDDVSWKLNGLAMSGEELPDMDMGIKLGSRNIPDQVIADVADSYPHIEFSMTSPGELGFDAGVSIPVDKSNAGMNATVYKYDSAKKELEMIGTVLVDDNGYAEFRVTEAADYTVIVSPEKTLAAPSAFVTNTVERNDTGSSAIRFNDVFKSRGGRALWLFLIALVSAGTCVAILFTPSLQLNDEL